MKYIREDSYQYDIAIIGSGMSGLALAGLLLNKKILIVEKRENPETAILENRSINFTLTDRGIKTIDQLGLYQKICSNSVKLKDRCIHTKKGEQLIQSYSKNNNHSLYSIKRQILLEVLFKKVTENKNIEFIFNSKLLNINPLARKIKILKDDKEEVISARMIIGADGTFSQIRNEILKQSPCQLKYRVFNWFYQEFILSSEAVHEMKLDRARLHIWPLEHIVLIGMPNVDQSFSCILLRKINKFSVDNSLELAQQIFQLVQKFYPEWKNCKENLIAQLAKNSVNPLMELTISKWYISDWLVLLGDACHSMYPFYGQGLNSALEDALILANAINNSFNQKLAIKKYIFKRKSNGKAICELSRKHFYELTRSDNHLRYSVNRALNNLFANLWLFEYDAVAHTNLPYYKILKQIKLQNKIIKPIFTIIAVINYLKKLIKIKILMRSKQHEKIS